MFTWFKSFFTPTVDKVTADITKLIEHLHAVEEHHLNLSALHDEAIMAAVKFKTEAVKEAARASTIIKKWMDMV